MSDSLWPNGLYSPWNSLGQNTRVGSLSRIQGSSKPRDRTLVSHIAGGFFTSWATREAQECWSGKIQWTFPIQESKWGLLYCRQILYQLSYQGSPSKMENNAGDLGSVPGLGRSPGEGKDYPLQCSGLENFMDCIVHRITKSRTQLSDFHFHCFHAYSIHYISLQNPNLDGLYYCFPRNIHFLYFMVATTVHSGFGNQENKICHCFHFFWMYLPWSDMTMILVFEYWVLSQNFQSPLLPSSRSSLVPLHFLSFVVVTVQLLSHVQLFVTPWTAARQASPSFTVSLSLLKLMSIELVMPPNHLILCHLLLLLPSIFPSIRVFPNELALCMRWPQYLTNTSHDVTKVLDHQSFQWMSISISPSNEYPELISLRIDWFDLFAIQETHKSLLQHHSSKAQFLGGYPSLLSDYLVYT